jgi:S1-C subfamily serine protease
VSKGFRHKFWDIAAGGLLLGYSAIASMTLAGRSLSAQTYPLFQLEDHQSVQSAQLDQPTRSSKSTGQIDTSTQPQRLERLERSNLLATYSVIADHASRYQLNPSHNFNHPLITEPARIANLDPAIATQFDLPPAPVSITPANPATTATTNQLNPADQFNQSYSNPIDPIDQINQTEPAKRSTPPTPPPIYAQDVNEQTNIRVYEIASPAVVSIQAGRGNGSGTIVDPKGLVLTSAHVVRTAQKVTVRLLDDRQFPGQVIASSRDPDLALIRLEGVDEPLPYVEVVDSSESIKVGQRAFAIGNPFGRFAGTLTTGIVSRIDRQRNLLQTDAAINPGNSGGPLLNSRGQLIGVNSAIFTSRGNEGSIGLGFAIAANQVQEFIVAALAGQIGIDNSFKPPITLALNGQVSRAALTASDETLPDGSFYKAYTFAGRSGQKVTLQMRSNEIDSYMILLDSEGNKIAEDDDSGSGNDAAITVTLPNDGNYVVYANSYDVGEVGNFTISAQPHNPSPSRPNNTISQPCRVSQYRLILPALLVPLSLG